MYPDSEILSNEELEQICDEFVECDWSLDDYTAPLVALGVRALSPDGLEEHVEFKNEGIWSSITGWKVLRGIDPMHFRRL